MFVYKPRREDGHHKWSWTHLGIFPWKKICVRHAITKIAQRMLNVLHTQDKFRCSDTPIVRFERNKYVSNCIKTQAEDFITHFTFLKTCITVANGIVKVNSSNEITSSRDV